MQADFLYLPSCNGAGLQLSATVIADSPVVAAMLRDDAESAGLRILHSCTLEEFSDAGITALGDIVLIDCPAPGAAQVALLSRLDTRARQSGAHCIASTVLAGLDAVFGCFSQSAGQILVDPTRADRILALGRTLAEVPNLRLREMAEDDRLMLLRLTEQVGRIAQRLDGLPLGQAADGGAFRLEAARREWRGDAGDYGLAFRGGSALPEPALIRRMIKARQARARFFDGELFADPAWDMLLDLAAAEGEGRQVCVTSLCIAAGVPATTALRWIAQMVESGLLVRVQDRSDRRRAFIALASATRELLARYFADAGAEAELLPA